MTRKTRPYVYEDFFGGQRPEGGFQHVCGMQGYDPWRDTPCPACMDRGEAIRGETAPD